MEVLYPQFPSRIDLVASVSGSFELSDFSLLQCFLDNKRFIELGIQLLPALVELYKWMHTKLGKLGSVCNKFQYNCQCTCKYLYNSSIQTA